MNVVRILGVLRRHQDRPLGYLIAAFVMAFALGIREAVDPHVKIPFVTLFPAIVICSLVGGRLAGILSAILGGLVSWYLWVPPRHSFQIEWPTGHLTVTLYVATSAILLLLTRGVNESLRTLERERNLSADLFRELQHRTANNLQNISAMLRQNRRRIEADPRVALDVLQSAERRFEVMSKINRRLYSPDVQSVEATALLREICAEIKHVSGCDHIVVDIKPTEVVLTGELPMLLSLLVAELMLNAIKHAFDEGQSGAVSIELLAKGSNYQFSFSDDGKGFPPGMSPGIGDGLGSRIVAGLVNQLDGTINTTSGSSGTKVQVLIPIRR